MSQEYMFTGNERATTIARSANGVVVTYHSTKVVEIDYLAGTVTFRTGGWERPTTRRRMNQTAHTYDLPFRAFIKDYGLYIEDERDGKVYGQFPITFDLANGGVKGI